MFIYSVRASSIKFFLLVGATLLLLIVLVSMSGAETVPVSVGGVEVDYGGMKSNEDRVKFIEGLGVMVKDAPVTEEVFRAPESFDRVIAGYNELQKSQGLDLSKYTKKRITHYAYEVENYDYDGRVLVNLLVYKNRIIACDVSSADGQGFVSPLVGLDTSKLKPGGAA